MEFKYDELQNLQVQLKLDRNTVGANNGSLKQGIMRRFLKQNC